MHDLVIIGAGPAGMAAALQVAEARLSVVVIDEQARAGGQIFRRPPTASGVAHGTYRPYAWARDLIERFENHPLIDARFRATAFGILRTDDGGAELAVSDARGGQRIAARRLLIATGAYDMPVAFPGWTLPGVMTAGAVQSLLKSQKLLAARRIVIAGSHPIQLILAAQLLEAGADLRAIAIARDLPGVIETARALPAVPGHVSIFVEAARAMATILRHRVPIHWKTVIAEVSETGDARDIRLQKVDAVWQPTGAALTVEADVLALSYGFTPSTELARQAGCRLDWHGAGGGWTVAHDAEFCSSVPDIFVAGEPTGVAGAGRAQAEGVAAGQAIARSLGADVPARQVRATERLLARSDRFATVMQRMFDPERSALADLSRTPDTLVCRCEEVQSGILQQALDDNPFLMSASAAKLECRTGMGVCQGRYCEGTVAARIAAARRTPIDSAGYFNAHLPVKPVPLTAYALVTETPRKNPTTLKG